METLNNLRPGRSSPKTFLTVSSVLLGSLLASTAWAQTPEFQISPDDVYYYDASFTPEGQVDLDFDQLIRQAKSRSYAERANLFGAPNIEVRRNFVYIQDTDNALTIPWQSNNDFNDSVQFVFDNLYSVLPDEFENVILYTSFQTGIGAFFYQPLANDVRGIGQYVFDNTGPSPLTGFIFMNYWKSFEDQWGQFGQEVVQGFMRHTFNQEFGHRWLIQFVTDPTNDGHLQKLLGRDDAHWSYFMHSFGSPMEGNSWRDNGNGTFSTQTNFNNWRYNDVDLYIMGLVNTDEVRPWFLIDNPNVGNEQDIYGRSPLRDSPPQILQPVTIRGDRLDYTVDDITSRLGPRRPEFGAAPTNFRVAFVMLTGAGGLAESQLQQFEQMVDLSAQGFQLAARERGQLDYILADVPLQPLGGLCQAASECDPSEASICVTPPSAAEGFCSNACSTVSDCAQGWCCAPNGQNGGLVCQPSEFCPTEPPPDAGTTDPDGGSTQNDGGTTDPMGCACDITTICDPNESGDSYCACDPECACECDMTTACDEGCTCDPDPGCMGDPLLRDEEPGCGCSSVPADGTTSPWFLLGLAGLLIVRRRFS